MDSREFLDSARRLANGVTEGDWRSSISRSYYFVSHFFRELFRSEGLNLGQGGQAHNNLYVGLNNCGSTEAADIAMRIDLLRGERVRADYDLALAIPQSTATVYVNEADSIVADFQDQWNGPAVQPIVAGAKAYLQSIGRLPKSP